MRNRVFYMVELHWAGPTLGPEVLGPYWSLSEAWRVMAATRASDITGVIRRSDLGTLSN